jgi:hypothetical protein
LVDSRQWLPLFEADLVDVFIKVIRNLYIPLFPQHPMLAAMAAMSMGAISWERSFRVSLARLSFCQLQFALDVVEARLPLYNNHRLRISPWR